MISSDWTLVVAMALNGVIGRENSLPWHLRSDLQRFKRLTMGHCLLMGRKTYESIGRPLPGRQTVVLTRSDFATNAPTVAIARQLDEVEDLVDRDRRVMVVGGAEVYRSALPRCNTLWLTRVLAEVQGDTYFPELEMSQWILDSSEHCEAGPRDDWPTEFQTWKRRTD